MDNKPFIEAYQEINTRMIRLIGSMSALRELSDMKLCQVDESQLLEESLRILLDNHELDFMIVYLQEGTGLQPAASRGWGENREQQYDEVLPVLQQLAARALDSTGIEHEHDIPIADGQGSALALPLLAAGDRLGAVCAFNPDAEFFTPAHERSLLIYCNFLAHLILNSRLFRDMDSLVCQRTEQLEAALAEARQLKQRYEELAVIDELTGLHNRRFFFPEAHAAVAQAVRYGSPLSLVEMDVDRFKRINDLFGHGMGDTVLRDVAKVLQEEKREADVLARFGGEEFIMLLPETDQEGAVVFTERLRRQISRLCWEVDGRTITVSASFGLTGLQHPEQGDARQVLEILVQQADAALYHSKENGRDRVSRYSDIGCTI